MRKLIKALRERARIGVRARHASTLAAPLASHPGVQRPRRQPRRLQRLGRVLALSVAIGSTVHVVLKVDLAPCGNHPARDLG